MLRTGKEHTASLHDGRIVYIGDERVDDVTQHSAFRNAAQTVAAIYDMKADPANRDAMSYEEDGGRHSMYFLRAKSRDDLQRRMICHRRISDLTYGMFGRSPDHVASFITGMVMKPDEVKSPYAHADNLLAYYRHARDNDLYIVYAVLPPQAARNPEFYQRQNIPVPTLRVVHEDDSGVVISGMKMLATGAVFANEIWIGNLLPLAPDHADLARDFQTYWQTPQSDAVTRMKLFKLAWDMVGSEFAGRHLQYEKFYAGASFIVRNHAFRETDWASFNRVAEDLMASYDHDGGITKVAAE